MTPSELIALLRDPDDAPEVPERFPFLEVLPALDESSGTLLVASPTFHRIAHELWGERYPSDWNVVSRQGLPFRRHLRLVRAATADSTRVHFFGDLLPESLLAFAAYRLGGIDAERADERLVVSYRGVGRVAGGSRRDPRRGRARRPHLASRRDHELPPRSGD